MKTSKMPKTIQKWLDKNKDIIDEYWIEDDYFLGHGSPYSVWCYLKPDYINTNSETGIIHEGTAKDFLIEVKGVRKRTPEEM